MRKCGVLMHITSLPSPYGVGTLGREAREFVKWLKKAGQSLWQVLPLGTTSFGDSPYQSFSAFAGNHYLIDLETLVSDGLLTAEECKSADLSTTEARVDFAKLYKGKIPLLRQAFKRFKPDSAYEKFVSDESGWLEDYALFMAVKDRFGGESWLFWDDDIRFRKADAVDKYKTELADDISFWAFTQFIFYRQWHSLKAECAENGIEVIGDLPIYVALDSTDVWANPEIFLLDSDFKPTKVAGVPPDYFSKTGQLWGNPLYDWRALKESGYAWWIRRMKKAAELYDVFRIDHFRAFADYYAIPAGDKTAENGEWLDGAGLDFFNAITKALGDVSIIAEDLGEISPAVEKLLAETGFPGMRVLQFGFNGDGSDSSHLPHNYPQNCVAYTGTHDNETFAGWYKSVDKTMQRRVRKFLRISGFGAAKKVCQAAIAALYASSADTVIIPFQDVLALGSESRMNTPSTIGGNWAYRAGKADINEKNAGFLYKLSRAYFRSGE